MSGALTSGVTGLQAHQMMLDIAGNNLANVNSTAFKTSRVIFSELLSETIKKASQPTSTVGGTNPQQTGSGVGIAGISPNVTQGNIVNTGNPLDMAIEGEGYFVLSDGEQNVYTRAGAFSVDADSYLVDPSNGYKVQRIGSIGEEDGFQTAGDSNLKVPYDVAMPASATSEVTVSGNLSSDNAFTTTQTNVMTADIAFTISGSVATATDTLISLDQFSGSSITSGSTLTFTAYKQNGGSAISGSLTVSDTTTLQDVLDYLNSSSVFDSSDTTNGSTASLSNGKIRITDNASGYSQTGIHGMTYTTSGSESLTVPNYFEITTVGGEEVKNINITVYDTQGGKHVMSGAFVRTDAANTWEMILTSITGDVYNLTYDNRRIAGIEFDASDGSYSGLNTTTGDSAQFVITFDHDTVSPQTIEIDLGTAGQFNGLTQFAGSSTAVAREQDGYAAGRLSTVSVNNEGIAIGAFSNGIKKNLATLQIALFQNTQGLESVGNGYFIPSANSGEAIATQALTGGAGSVLGGSLEKSNADVATEFVNMIQAQNGFQANARTIRVANDILRELSNLIR